MKCHLSCVRTHGIPPIQCIRNVQEISCILGTGNVHETVPYTVSGNPQEMYKFHVVRNVHTMNRKCDLSYTFLGISQSRKFKISSSACYNYYVSLCSHSNNTSSLNPTSKCHTCSQGYKYNLLMHYIIIVRELSAHIYLLYSDNTLYKKPSE